MGNENSTISNNQRSGKTAQSYKNDIKNEDKSIEVLTDEIFDIASHLWNNYAKDFLNPRFCNNIALVYKDKLSELDVKILTGINEKLKKGTEDSDLALMMKYHLDPAHDKFDVEELKEVLTNHFYQKFVNITKNHSLYTNNKNKTENTNSKLSSSKGITVKVTGVPYIKTFIYNYMSKLIDSKNREEHANANDRNENINNSSQLGGAPNNNNNNNDNNNNNNNDNGNTNNNRNKKWNRNDNNDNNSNMSNQNASNNIGKLLSGFTVNNNGNNDNGNNRRNDRRVNQNRPKRGNATQSNLSNLLGNMGKNNTSRKYSEYTSTTNKNNENNKKENNDIAKILGNEIGGINSLVDIETKNGNKYGEPSIGNIIQPLSEPEININTEKRKNKTNKLNVADTPSFNNRNKPKFPYTIQEEVTFPNCTNSEKPCLLTKDELCRAIVRHYTIRANIIGAIVSVLPTKKDGNIFGGFCYDRLTALKDFKICLPPNYRDFASMSVEKKVTELSKFVNNMFQKKCISVGGYYKKLTPQEIELLQKNIKNPFNDLFFEYREKLYIAYHQGLRQLKRILLLLKNEIIISNIALDKVSQEAKVTIDNLYGMCQLNYMIAVLAILDADYSPSKNTSNQLKRNTLKKLQGL